MKKENKAKNIIAAAIVSVAMMVAKPVQAFVWPCIDPAVIAKFVSQISTGIGQVTSAKTQIESYIKQIHAIGSQISALAKVIKSIKDAITNLIHMIVDMTFLLKREIQNVSTIMGDIKTNLDNNNSKIETNAGKTVDNIESGIENLDNDDLQGILDEGKTEDLLVIEDNNQNLIQAKETITTILDKADETITKLLDNVDIKEILEDKVKEELKNEAEVLHNKITDFKDQALEILDEAIDKNKGNAEKINKEYLEYSQKISDYYEGKITKDELKEAGLAFKNGLKSLDTSIETDKIDKLVSDAEDLAASVDTFMEKVVDSLANSKLYSDEEDKTSAKEDSLSQKFVFSYTSENEQTYSKEVYNSNEFKNFLYSGEFACKDIKGDDGWKKIGSDQENWLLSFRDCVVHAKTDKEYLCPDIDNLADLEKDECNHFKNSEFKDLYKGLEKFGVYKHIYEDYSLANIVNANQLKQYATDWQDINDKKSQLNELKEVIEKATGNTRDSNTGLSMTELELPQMWSKIRTVDALKRAKDVVNHYRQAEQLYINKDEEYLNAIAQKSGSDGDVNLVSDVFVNLCDISGKDIVATEGDKKEEAEKKVKECLKKYAEGATKDTGNEGDVTKEEGITTVVTKQIQWREREEKALIDSMFNSLALGTINLYKSSMDYDENEEENILALSKEIGAEEPSGGGGEEGPTDQHVDYTVGAKINKYAAQQILSIIDADAQSLQTEIIQDLRLMTYNFFGEEGGSN